VRLFAVDYRPIDRDGPWPGCGLFAKHPLSCVHHQQIVRFFDLKAGERFVAVKRAAMPPATLVDAWALWWEVHHARRIPAAMFRPMPRVDNGLLTVARRDPPLLPVAMARPYADFVRREWPFAIMTA
jgi:16S rRNA A1518/A1519 N6-dimethyltransferase RsmA/KsgA/DIM1 with predicted DNA glycosylase/AP lyase activity